MPVVKTLCKNEYGQLISGTDNGVFLVNPETRVIREIHPSVAWDCFRHRWRHLVRYRQRMLALRQHPVILLFPVS